MKETTQPLLAEAGKSIKELEKILAFLPTYAILIFIGLVLITFLISMWLKWKFLIGIGIAILITGITSLFLPGLLIDKVIAIVPAKWREFLPANSLSSFLAVLIAYITYTILMIIVFITTLIINYTRARKRFPLWKRLVTGSLGAALTIPYASTIANPLLLSSQNKTFNSFTGSALKIITFGKGTSWAGLFSFETQELVSKLTSASGREKLFNQILNSKDLKNEASVKELKRIIEEPRLQEATTEIIKNVVKEELKKNEKNVNNLKTEVQKIKSSVINKLKQEDSSFDSLPAQQQAQKIKESLTKDVEKQVNNFLTNNKNNKEVNEIISVVKKLNKEFDSKQATEVFGKMTDSVLKDIIPADVLDSINAQEIINNFLTNNN
ncbi:hypothetical protein GE118_01150 [Mycoplasma sp. NEAQ87857]|uniref:hypothetical protein n=1 Tax=Mycoplasma sp. NEAQ87857 TaxID=2683967 RepID=UPI0013174A47|nr:hypothetical protein [Mycoplasma sp. NEAQ87857]QGZ97400.1 hypothetical protein GE118_01150 [Mycoplasma sp. NEAQ87857]